MEDATYTIADFCAFSEIARKCNSYPEFMMEVVFRGQAKLGAIEFFKRIIDPLWTGCLPGVFKHNEFIDEARVLKHMRSFVDSIPWLQDYISAKRSELESAEVSNVTRS